MESVASFEQESQILQQQLQSKKQQTIPHQQQLNLPTTSQLQEPSRVTVPQSECFESSVHQNSYQVKCNLLEYHIQEAVLVNKALRAELKQYREKIDFEKRLREFLVDRIKGIEP